MVANLLVLSYLTSFIIGGLAGVINVLDHGAVGDGQKDDTNAFSTAWTTACNNNASQTMLVPRGKTFLVSAVVFAGPCKSLVHVQKCSDAPYVVSFDFCNNVTVSGLKFLNSPSKHIFFFVVNGGSLNGISITAPGDSLNTDGIYIAQSQHIDISNSRIGTGDDCITIGPGSSNINITYINCGPGHGISIGSLGSEGSSTSVNQIHVSSCHFEGTTSGVRIKTRPVGSGLAKHITFKDINFTAVQNPIVIDQFYDYRGPDPRRSTVQIQDVRYIGVSGTTTSEFAITLNCSSSVPCTGITMDNVNIKSSRGVAPKAYCKNARGIKTKQVSPIVSCLN